MMTLIIFVQMLKPGLKEPYLARINKWVSPPVLESFVINSGQEFTQDRNVILNITYSGQAPSPLYGFRGYVVYREPHGLNMWKNRHSSCLPGFNAKTVYVKLKNNAYGKPLEPTLLRQLRRYREM